MAVVVSINGAVFDVPPQGSVTVGRATRPPDGSDARYVKHVHVAPTRATDRRMSRWALRVTDLGYSYAITSWQGAGHGVVRVRAAPRSWLTLNQNEAVTWSSAAADAEIVLAGDASAAATLSIKATDLMHLPGAPAAATDATAATHADPVAHRDISKAEPWKRVLAALCADYVRTGRVTDIYSSRARSLFNTISGIAPGRTRPYYDAIDDARDRLNAPKETVDLTDLAKMALELRLVTRSDAAAVLRYAGRSPGPEGRSP